MVKGPTEIVQILSCSANHFFMAPDILRNLNVNNNKMGNQYLLSYLLVIELRHKGFYLKIFFLIFNFLRQRETEYEWGRGRERGRHSI